MKIQITFVIFLKFQNTYDLPKCNTYNTYLNRQSTLSKLSEKSAKKNAYFRKHWQLSRLYNILVKLTSERFVFSTPTAASLSLGESNLLLRALALCSFLQWRSRCGDRASRAREEGTCCRALRCAREWGLRPMIRPWFPGFSRMTVPKKERNRSRRVS